jgi:asparagine synthase (glutamine-hydrolysing)
MTRKLNLGHYRGYTWSIAPNLHYIGNLSAANVEQLKSLAVLPDEQLYARLDSFLGEASDLFSAIIDTDTSYVLVVDHVGAFPLYYSTNDDSVISDSAFLCSESMQQDPIGMNELKHCGETLGIRTVWENVNSVRNGTYVTIAKATNAIVTNTYWSVSRSFSESKSNDHELNCLANRVFNQATDQLGCRAAVVPVTAGIDSRGLAVLLKEQGVNNIISFSIGKEDSKDVVKGKYVAKQLGLKWHHVDPDGKSWNQFFQSDLYHKHILYSFGGGRMDRSLMAHALSILAAEDAFPAESVFFPGHAGAIMGGELTHFVYPNKEYSLDQLISMILRHESYLSMPNSSAYEMIAGEYAAEIRRISPSQESWDSSRSLEIDDILHTENYIFKFIMNDVRNYEFFGYKWYTPFMNRSWIDYWSRRTHDECMYKSLFVNYINRISSSYLEPFVIHKPSGLSVAKSTLASNPTINRFARTHYPSNLILKGKSHPLSLFDAISNEEYLALFREFRGTSAPINSKIVQDSLDFLEEMGLLKKS